MAKVAAAQEIGDSTVLEAEHQYRLSQGRSCREPLAVGRGQRTLDRRFDWALSSQRKPGLAFQNHGGSLDRIDGWWNNSTESDSPAGFQASVLTSLAATWRSQALSWKRVS